MSKLRFARDSDGDFNFAEARLSRFVEALRPRTGQAGPMVPQTLMEAASRELVQSVNRIADQRRIEFAQAAAVAVKERPSLFWLTRGVCVPDHDPSADVEVS
jgi:hypothetical protein